MPGLIIGCILIAIVVIIIIYAFVTYNQFIQLGNQVKEAFATMDVYLKKRWDLIPNILESVKGYMQYEEKTLKDIVELRNQTYEKMNAEDKLGINNQLSQGIQKLMAIAEDYPELKASENFQDLHQQLAKVEEDIANARKYYNAVVRHYNNKVEMFPSNLFAKLYHQQVKEMYEVSEQERENVKVEF